MEPLKRMLMLLKPGEGFRLPPGKNGGMLKIQSAGKGLTVTLKADCLGEGDYFLYLFSGVKDIYAGDVRNGALFTALSGVRLDDITGAAVVRRDGDSFMFCLKSTGPDWPALVKRFRAARSAPKESPKADAAHAATVPVVEAASIAKAIPDIQAEPKYFGIPQTLYKEAEAERPEMPQEIIEELERQSEINERAEPGFEEEGCDDCPGAQREEGINPFPSVFPNSEWVKISYPGPAGWWHYISGRIYKGGSLVAKALGVPGEYGMAPPVWLEGFGTYLRCMAADARGYWLMFQDAETGEVLDMGLSPRGA